MDFLSSWMQTLTDRNFLTSPFPQCKPCLLYADDTLIFLKPDRTQILKCKLVLDIFGLLSGLKINPLKSELVISSPLPSQTLDLAETIQCKPATFPIQYLGLPLSDKKLTKPDYIPLISKVQKMLSGWKAPLLTIGGRLILTNAVLTAIPHYFMSAFLLPTWVVHKIDQIRKKFLWHGHKDEQRQLRSLYMVNWSLATKPRDQGGLGVRDIRIANQALLMKWMWLWHDSSQAWWRQPSQMLQQNMRPWDDSHSSHFWKGVNACSSAFRCSTKFQVGNGKETSFWIDNWNDSPLKHKYPKLYEENQHKYGSVHQFLTEGGLLSQLQSLDPLAQAEKEQMVLQLQHIILTQHRDSITWLRSATSFTVSSAYHFLSHGPSPASCLHHVWSIKAPLRVTVFTWLMLSNRLPTIDNLVKKGWQLPSICVLCKRNAESVKHIFNQCPLTTEIRSYIASTVTTQRNVSPKFLTDDSMQVLTNPTENSHARQWELVTCFIMWRERCRRVFSDLMATQIMLVREIRTEHACWFS